MPGALANSSVNQSITEKVNEIKKVQEKTTKQQKEVKTTQAKTVQVKKDNKKKVEALKKEVTPKKDV